MRYAIEFAIILCFAFVGEILNWLIPLPVPASIYGIILLFTALELKIVKVDDIRHAGTFLIKSMPIMFLPAIVGILDVWPAVKESAVQFIVITVVTTFIVMAAAGWTTQFIVKKSKKDE